MDVSRGVALVDGGEIRLDPAPRETQVARAQEFHRNWSSAAIFSIGDDQLGLGLVSAHSPTPAVTPGDTATPAPAPVAAAAPAPVAAAASVAAPPAQAPAGSSPR